MTIFSRLVVAVSLSLAVGDASPLSAKEDDPIQIAIGKGVAYLQSIHKPAADYRGGSHGMGTATLSGLALLEAGVPETDPSVQAIARYVRERAIEQTKTYELSLTILFLDRLGNPGDRPTIQLLGFRLMSGQSRNGGWSYNCGERFDPEEENRLRNLFSRESKLAERTIKTAPQPQELKSAAKDQPRSGLQETMPVEKLPAANQPVQVAGLPGGIPVLHPEVVKWARLVNTGQGDDAKVPGDGPDGDNSNTQFATLAMWCVRRHGLPCDKAIARLGQRFMSSQDSDGGWDYKYAYGGKGSTPSMTCAGLLGLAVTQGPTLSVLKTQPGLVAPKNGVKAGGIDAATEEAIKRGIKCLGNYITQAKGLPPEGVINPARKGKRFKADQLNGNLYFLWSLERVAMIYGLATIGNHDWYVWGADALADTQLENGSWGGKGYNGANNELNTCFALLFLSRANLARDLTTVLKGRITDPGVTVLRGGDLSKLPGLTQGPKGAAEVPGPTTPMKPAPVQPNALQLAESLVQATPQARAKMLDDLHNARGVVHTEALALAAARQSGEPQQITRDVLARRLTRMTPATLRDMLGDGDREIRRAAVRACGSKSDKKLIPDLIPLTTHDDAFIAQAARASLQELSGTDFGPLPSATATEKARSLLQWKNWWTEQPGKKDSD